MTTIDRRTRFAGPAEVMDAEQLFGDLAERLQETGALAARGVELLGLPPLTFEVDGTAAHLVVADGALDAARGACRRRAGHRARRHRVLRAVPGRRLDVRAASCPAASRCARRSRRPVRGVGTGAARRDRRAGGVRTRVDRVPRPQRRRSRPAAIVPRRRRARGHRPLPRRGGLPAPRRRVHRGGDGGGVGRARRRDGRGAPRTTARRGGRAPRTAGTRRASSGSTSSHRLSRSCSSRTGSRASARSPTTR